MNENMETRGYEGRTCKCPHHSVMPLLVVLLGLTFLLGHFGTLSANFVGTAWPVLLILIGLQKWFGRRCRCC